MTELALDSSGPARSKGRLATTLAVFTFLSAGTAEAAGDHRPPQKKPEMNDPLRLVVSLGKQEIGVWRGTTLIETSRISTGKPGHSTPPGVYSILQKRKWHRSNIYSNAPMPFMQRLTWSGIALHEGHVPDRPASHGCIRLPKGFARRLFGRTEVGVDVVVTEDESVLHPIEHAALFRPRPPEAAAHVALNSDWIGTAEVTSILARVNEDARAAEDRSSSPLRILVTRRTLRERIVDVQRLLAELGHDPGEADGFLGPDTGGAIQAFQRASGKPATGMFTEGLVADLFAAAGREEPSGHLYVRQDYVDLFEAPVSLKDPDAPLGTVMFSAGEFEPGDRDVRWTALKVDGAPGPTAAEVLDRLVIPADIRGRIAERLTPRSSLVVTDAGRGRETGKGTDFIVQP